ncbi:unnamed protein product [Paramecium sonneborni]|uniref:Transmembrane protein n=1 Tax=Paramecium sonneborni TaxID=65129 RepID=A0A8S1RN49_9CILI|nr:unnamed protein product [Paramecium sonneborni]CAD8128837.1 unnamed protein product [Paramecium sonneborni]
MPYQILNQYKLIQSSCKFELNTNSMSIFGSWYCKEGDYDQWNIIKYVQIRNQLIHQNLIALTNIMMKSNSYLIIYVDQISLRFSEQKTKIKISSNCLSCKPEKLKQNVYVDGYNEMGSTFFEQYISNWLLRIMKLVIVLEFQSLYLSVYLQQQLLKAIYLRILVRLYFIFILIFIFC